MQNNNSKFKTDLKSRAYYLALEIMSLIDVTNQKDFSVQVISKQLLRSITRIGANTIEAQAGSSKKDFTNFLSHALKSANESKFWLALLRDSKKGPDDKISKSLEETKELANILASSIITLKNK